MHALVVVDDHSRFLVLCRLFQQATMDEVTESLLWAFRRFGKPRRILTDNSFAFRDQFREFCRSRGIQHEAAPPYYPETKGKVERTIRNFKKEFLVLDKVFERPADLLPEYIRWYNEDRLSLGIGGTPASVYA